MRSMSKDSEGFAIFKELHCARQDWSIPTLALFLKQINIIILFISFDIVVMGMNHKLYTLKMSSGVLAATSSISIPPWGLPTMTGPLQDRSIKMAKYVSLLMSRASATITWIWHSRSKRGWWRNATTITGWVSDYVKCTNCCLLAILYFP